MSKQQQSLATLEAERARLGLDPQKERDETKHHVTHLVQVNIKLRQQLEAQLTSERSVNQRFHELEETNAMVLEELELMRLKDKHRVLQLQKYDDDYKLLLSSYKELVKASSNMGLSRRDLVSALAQRKNKMSVLQSALETLDSEIQNLSKAVAANQTREQSVGRALREYGKHNRALEDVVGETKKQLCCILDPLRSSERRKTQAVIEASALKRDLVVEKCQRSDLLRQCDELERCLAFCHTSATKTQQRAQLLQTENSVLQNAISQLCAYSHELVSPQQTLQRELKQLEVKSKAELRKAQMSGAASPHLPSSPASKKLKLSPDSSSSTISASNSTMSTQHEHLTHSIVGLGNPLLDISADVDQEFLEKYGLKLDNAILADETHLPLYEEITTAYKPVFVAGGATQNSIRVAQWMLNKHNNKATSFFGSVGKDDHAKILRDCATRDGVNVHYLEKEDVATGTCAVCVVDSERSLVANLSAANHYHHEHLESEVSQDLISKGKFFYSAGFHLTVSPPAMMKLAEHANEHNKVFMLNLSAPFLVQFFKDPLMAAIPYADFVFGNESEAKEFGTAHGWGDDVKTIALKLAKLPKNNGARSRTVVFTQGAEPTIAVYQGEVFSFDVPKLAASEIIDTNGAGDAFVGGFVSRLSLGKPLVDCVNAGHWAAQVVLRRSGCTFPAECEYTD